MEQFVGMTKNIPNFYFPLIFRVSASSKCVNEGQYAWRWCLLIDCPAWAHTAQETAAYWDVTMAWARAVGKAVV